MPSFRHNNKARGNKNNRGTVRRGEVCASTSSFSCFVVQCMDIPSCPLPAKVRTSSGALTEVFIGDALSPFPPRDLLHCLQVPLSLDPRLYSRVRADGAVEADGGPVRFPHVPPGCHKWRVGMPAPRGWLFVRTTSNGGRGGGMQGSAEKE